MRDIRAGQLCQIFGTVGPDHRAAPIWKVKLHVPTFGLPHQVAVSTRIREGTIVLFLEYIHHSSNTMCKILVNDKIYHIGSESLRALGTDA